jgi:hypothetical protein
VSEKIDGTYKLLDLSQPVTAGLIVLNNILCYGLMVTYLDPDNQGQGRKIILMISQDGKWFVGSQGDSLVRMAHVEHRGTYRLFGADLNTVRELFIQEHYPVHNLKTPLYDAGDVTMGKEFVRAAMVMNYEEATPVVATFTPVAFTGQKRVQVAERTNEVEFTPAQGEDIEWTGSGGAGLRFIAKDYAMPQWMVGMNSKLVGFNISFDSDPFEILAYAGDVISRESWGDIR